MVVTKTPRNEPDMLKGPRRHDVIRSGQHRRKRPAETGCDSGRIAHNPAADAARAATQKGHQPITLLEMLAVSCIALIS
jgi:hypothetical protein